MSSILFTNQSGICNPQLESKAQSNIYCSNQSAIHRYNGTKNCNITAYLSPQVTKAHAHRRDKGRNTHVAHVARRAPKGCGHTPNFWRSWTIDRAAQRKESPVQVRGAEVPWSGPATGSRSCSRATAGSHSWSTATDDSWSCGEIDGVLGVVGGGGWQIRGSATGAAPDGAAAGEESWQAGPAHGRR